MANCSCGDDHDDPNIVIAHLLPGQERDRAQMVNDAARLEIHGLLDTLTPDHLLTLRRILNQNQRMIDFTDGQVAAILRVVHRVDPATGRSLDVPFEEMQGPAPVEPA